MNPEEILAAVEGVRRGVDRMDARVSHLEELLELRLAALERAEQDHEGRLRTAGESLAKLTAVGSLAQALQAGLALLLSALAAWLGMRQ